MRQRMAFVGALLVAAGALVSGCKGQPESAAPTAPAAGGEQAVALGTKQTAGQSEITLTMEPAEPKAGDTRFVAQVQHEGKPQMDAVVKIKLSMPSMNMDGPTADLKHTSGGRYEGIANLSMGGDWRADATITDHHGSQTVSYSFKASQ